MNRAEKRRQQKLARKAANKGAAGTATADLVQRGLGLHRLGRLGEAQDIYREALRVEPRNAEALHLMGLVALQSGRHAEAAKLISRAIRENPDNAAYHGNLGLALQGLGDLEAAVANFEHAVALDAGLASAHNNLGFARLECRRPAEAAEACRKALAIDPEYCEAHCNLGNALRQQGKPEEAEECYRQAITLRPDMAEAHYNLGNVLNDQGRAEAAVASFRKAIALKPDYAKAHCNLASTLKELGRLDEAVNGFNTALELEPNSPTAHTNVIFIQDFCPETDLATQQAERQRWNEKFILPVAGKIRRHRNDRDPDRRLRIGYVSADFRAHSACLGFAPLILDHNRDRFEVVCYAGNTAEDSMLESLRAAATQWRQTDRLSDDALAETIRNDRIDILVDLSGHSAGNRLLSFGRKPAPVQVTGIGHLAPGVSTIDYRLTTAAFSRPEEESLYPEQPVYLDVPFGFLPPADAPDLAAPGRGRRRDLRLPEPAVQDLGRGDRPVGTNP